MKITEKQLLMLYQTLKDTLIFYEREKGDPFSFSYNTRKELLDDICNQQSEKIIDVVDDSTKYDPQPGWRS
mgnify:CR=1 FL=1